MQLKIDGEIYDLASLNKMTLWDLIAMKKETGFTANDIETRAPKGMDDPEAVGVLIWLARVKAGCTGTNGRPIGFEESLSFPMSELEVIFSEEELRLKEEAEAEAARIAADPTLPLGDEAVAPADLAAKRPATVSRSRTTSKRTRVTASL